MGYLHLAGYRLAAAIDTEYVDTYPVFMNVTLSLDEQLVERARKRPTPSARA